jgi:hypothetical protein
MSHRASLLAVRLEQGALALHGLASSLTDDEWQLRVPGDGRKVGVLVHHVADVYPLEIELAGKMANGHALEGVTWADVHAMNARHAADHAETDREVTLELLLKNSAAAAAAIRALTDEQLDRAVTNSLYDDAPLTCQFMLEDHAVRHSYHHMAVISRALKAAREVS